MGPLDIWGQLKSRVTSGDRLDALEKTPEYLRQFYSKVPRFIRVYLMALYLFVKNEKLSKTAPAVAALLYFVMPLDVLPDVLPLLGFADDIAVLQFAVRYLRRELKPFLTEAKDEVIKMESKLNSTGHREGDNLH